MYLSCALLAFMTFEGTLFKESVCAMKMFANMAVLEREPTIFFFIGKLSVKYFSQ